MTNSTTTDRRGILAINDGQPFGWVEDLAFGSHGFGTAMYVLGACACLVRFQADESPRCDVGNGERGMEATLFETPRGGWGAFLGIGERTAWRYLREHERAERIEKIEAAPGRRTSWAFTTSPLERRDYGERMRRIDLAPMGDPDWGDGTRAVWLALCQHARLPGKRKCYPSIERLSRDSGLDRRNVQRQLRRMIEGGYLARNLRAGSTVYALHPTGNAPPSAPNPCHQRRPSRAASAAPPVPPAPPTRATSAAPPVPPAPPEVEPLKLNFEVEPSKSSHSSATAPKRRDGARAPEGCIDENSPKVRQARRQAQRILERLEREQRPRETTEVDGEPT